MTDQIHIANPDKVEQFATDLIRYVDAMREIEAQIDHGLTHLSHTWQDEHYDQFRDLFKKVKDQLPQFTEAARDIPAKLFLYAEKVRAIHKE